MIETFSIEKRTHNTIFLKTYKFHTKIGLQIQYVYSFYFIDNNWHCNEVIP